MNNTFDNIIKSWHNYEVSAELYKRYRAKNIPIPARFSQLKKFQKKPDFIMIHDTNCLDHKTAALSVDTGNANIGEIKSNNIVISGMKEVNYHFLVDKIGGDYEIVMARPFHYLCNHKDISDVYRYSIHILILSDMEIDMPKTRLYQVMAYKCIAPMMRMLHMNMNPKKTIVYHKEVLNEKFKQKDDHEIVRGYGKTRNVKHCPGKFLFKPLLTTQIQKYM